MVNVFLVKGERPILIDAGNPGNEGQILEQIAANDVEPKTISLIVITHVHPDHVGGLAAIKEQTGAQVAVHRAGTELLSQGRSQGVVPVTLLARLFARLLPEGGSFAGVVADHIVEDELDLTPFGVNGRVVATPGHTVDSMSVSLSGGEAIVGDLIMAFVRHRVPGYPIFANDMSQVHSSVRKILGWKPTMIYAGHGGPFEPEKVAAKFGEKG
jgi:glyoxylase-like metal-dependent hydrolase (beta-lactamase superfamily II)